MDMNIKNERAHSMAVEISGLTGETLTEAVTKALELRLISIKGKKTTVADIKKISEDCRIRLQPPFDKSDHGDILYDSWGLPI
jgi:hypothetical protein